jgi:hypothetical protein
MTRKNRKFSQLSVRVVERVLRHAQVQPSLERILLMTKSCLRLQAFYGM